MKTAKVVRAIGITYLAAGAILIIAAAGNMDGSEALGIAARGFWRLATAGLIAIAVGFISTTTAEWLKREARRSEQLPRLTTKINPPKVYHTERKGA